jgi:hypothetical protein
MSIQQVSSNLIGSLATTKLTGRVPVANATLGSVIQVVSTTKTDTFTTTSSSFVDITGLAASITPSSATSKILVMAQVVGGNSQTGGGSAVRLLRDSTAIAIGNADGSRAQSSTASFYDAEAGTTKQVGVTHLDSPNSTSAITYKLQTQAAGGTTAVNRSVDDANAVGRNRAVSSITLMEIAA